MNAPHPSFLFQADDQIELGRRRAAKAARLCPPPPPPSAPSSSIDVDARSASRYASLGHPVFLGTKQDDTAELALGGSGADGGREKILDALLEDPAGRCRGLWTAESGGIVRRVDLRTGKTTDVILAHKAPVSALALLPLPSSKGSSSQALLFSSGWDKSINIHLIALLSSSEDVPERPRRLKPLLTIHSASTDFIKALEVLGTEGILLSGGSEKVLRVWDLRPLIAWAGNEAREEQPPPTPRSIGSFGEHTRSITCITSLSPPPLPLTSATRKLLPSSTTIYSVDSMGRIFQLSLDLGEAPGRDEQATSSLPPPRARMVIQRELRGPETSISDLTVGWLVQKGEDDEDDDDTEHQQNEAVGSSVPTTSPVLNTKALIRAQVWTASNDKTVQLFIPFESDTRSSSSSTYRSLQQPSASGTPAMPHLSRVSKVGTALGSLPPLSPVLAVKHDDYVKSTLPLSLRPQEDALPRSLMISGSADEDLRIWRIDGMGNEDEDGTDGDGEDPSDDDDDDEDAGDETKRRPIKGGLTSLEDPRSRSIRSKLLRRQEGHWHELEKLLLWRGHISSPRFSYSKGIGEKEGQGEKKREEQEKEEWYVISTSLDGSIRRWSLPLLLTPQSREERDRLRLGLGLKDGGTSTSAPSGKALSDAERVRTGLVDGEREGEWEGGEVARRGGMTAEEERELEELLGSDDDYE